MLLYGAPLIGVLIVLLLKEARNNYFWIRIQADQKHPAFISEN